MSSQFINEIGREYAHDHLVGSAFRYEDAVYIVHNIPEESNSFTALNLETQQRRAFDMQLITGWRMFKYPKLGYRSFSSQYAAYVSRSMSYSRGLSVRNMAIAPTRFTQVLESAGHFNYTDANARLLVVMKPTFHTKEDVKRLFTGELPHVVLNEDVLIELPTISTGDDVVDVYYKNQFAGSITADLQIKRADDRKLIERIVNNHVA